VIRWPTKTPPSDYASLRTANKLFSAGLGGQPTDDAALDAILRRAAKLAHLHLEANMT
jgi:hypothetical protein